MKSMPKFSHLTIFKQIVCCGSLHETSKKLAISQPTLSRVIKELEENIGARLLERSNRGVRLTAVGEVFYQRIDGLTNQFRNTIYELRGMSSSGEKYLRVGMSTDPLLCYLNTALVTFNQRYPHTRVIIIEDCPEGLIAKLRNSELDLALCSLNHNANCADLVMQVLTCEHFSLYQGGDKKAAELPLAEANWVIPCSCSVGHAAIKDIAGQYTPHGKIVETDSFLATWCLVKQQGYLALLSDRVVAQYAPQLNLKKMPVEEIDINAHFYIFTRNEPVTPPLSTAFINILQTLQPA
ncbi:MAG: LysR family transcriptional regulator [Serratia grimesii]|jgi:LysR family tdc operon transcriptional activator|uniref:LysR family transcriptional regulator n=1 Tax=Serratia grimesii TaxID=82995 RepID=UPI003F9B554F